MYQPSKHRLNRTGAVKLVVAIARIEGGSTVNETSKRLLTLGNVSAQEAPPVGQITCELRACCAGTTRRARTTGSLNAERIDRRAPEADPWTLLGSALLAGGDATRFDARSVLRLRAILLERERAH